jgi:hypothetical protein
MRIGIDFDNTIVNYNKIFVEAAKNKKFITSSWFGNKEQLKKELSTKKNKWQIIQGLVYGPLMMNATCFPGLKKFLIKASFSNYKLYIISHKTIYGHFDETKTNLRLQALSWLQKNNFFDLNEISLKKENVFFCNDREAKINKINELSLDFMIDDLSEIFDNVIPKKTKKILFNENLILTKADYICKNWDQISNLIIPEKDNKKSLVQICNNFNLRNDIISINSVKTGGNSQVHKITNSNKEFLILKEYPNSQIVDKPRLKNEIKALNLLNKTNKVPKIIYNDHELNISILEYIDGRKINKITSQNLNDAMFFVEALYKIYSENNIKFELATEACLSGVDLLNQIDKRFVKLKNVENKNLQELLEKLLELNSVLSSRASKLWPQDNFKKNLSKKYLTFSPSDFGFHNSILNKKNELKFIDFEYFGVDDPVKLISDFLWHPGMKLSEKQKITFASHIIKIFDNDKFLIQRLNASFSLYGLRWALIILNDFLGEKMIRLHEVNQNNRFDYENHLKVQMDKSMEIYDNIISNKMECNYVK